MSTREYHFALLIAGLDVDNDDQVDAFYSYGLDDAVLEDRGEQALATLYREAISPEQAANSAIEDVERAVAGARVLRIDDQLVNATDIAELACRTPENIRQLASGTRGLGGFPAPAGVVGKGIRVWRWAEVRPWLAARDLADEAETLPPELITLINARLTETRTASTHFWQPVRGTSGAVSFFYESAGYVLQPKRPVAAEVDGSYLGRAVGDDSLGVSA